MANVSEEALRVIGTTRAWSKNYTVVRALAFNPKSPISISMTLVNRLVEKDVRMLSTDRNIAEPVKILARKIVQAGQSRKH
jgi:ABC-type lipopolysaccharide export system ATPase subunit